MTNKNSKFIILSLMTIIGLLFSKEAEQAFSDQHINTFGSSDGELMPSQSVSCVVPSSITTTLLGIGKS